MSELSLIMNDRQFKLISFRSTHREFKRQRTSDSPEKRDTQDSGDEVIERPSSSRKRNNRTTSTNAVPSSKRSSGRTRTGNDKKENRKEGMHISFLIT